MQVLDVSLCPSSAKRPGLTQALDRSIRKQHQCRQQASARSSNQPEPRTVVLGCQDAFDPALPPCHSADSRLSVTGFRSRKERCRQLDLQLRWWSWSKATAGTGLTIRSSRARFAASCKFIDKFHLPNFRKAARLNSGVRPLIRHQQSRSRQHHPSARRLFPADICVTFLAPARLSNFFARSELPQAGFSRKLLATLLLDVPLPVDANAAKRPRQKDNVIEFLWLSVQVPQSGSCQALLLGVRQAEASSRPRECMSEATLKPSRLAGTWPNNSFKPRPLRGSRCKW